MHSLLRATIGLVLVAVGCAPQAPAVAPEATAISEPPQATTPSVEARFPLPVSLGVTLSDEERPTSIEAFTAEFVRRFEQDLYAPFLELADWGPATDTGKREYLIGVRSTFTMPSRPQRAVLKGADDVKLMTAGEYGDAGYYPSEGDEAVRLQPPATHVLAVTAHYDESSRVTNYFAVGQKEGRFYFCTIAGSGAAAE